MSHDMPVAANTVLRTEMLYVVAILLEYRAWQCIVGFLSQERRGAETQYLLPGNFIWYCFMSFG